MGIGIVHFVLQQFSRIKLKCKIPTQALKHSKNVFSMHIANGYKLNKLEFIGIEKSIPFPVRLHHADYKLYIEISYRMRAGWWLFNIVYMIPCSTASFYKIPGTIFSFVVCMLVLIRMIGKKNIFLKIIPVFWYTARFETRFPRKINATNYKYAYHTYNNYYGITSFWAHMDF